MTENTRGAIIGFLGVIVGTFLAAGASYFQWVQQKKYDEQKYRREQKAYLIREAADILTRSGRIKGLVAGHVIQIAAAKAISSVCLASVMTGEQGKNCDLTEANKAMNEFNKEIFDTTAKYSSVKYLSKIYFCEETASAFDKMDNKQAWWDADDEQKKSVLSAMNKEINCDI